MFMPMTASMVESRPLYTTPPVSPESLPRIERVPRGLADEDQQRQHDRERQEAGNAEPWRVEVALALPEQFAQRGGAGRQAEAEEVERGQRGDGAVEDEG